MRKFLLYALLLISILSCKKGRIETFYKDLYLYASYSYPSGGSPELVLNFESSSSAINIDANNATATIQNQRAILDVFGVKIFDALGTYKILEIETQEFRNDVWEVDLENFLIASKSSSLDIVLVLDVSSSLVSDIQSVKSYANQFIDLIYSENSNSRVGIVGFSQNISVFNLSSNAIAAKNFVSSLNSDDATKLYEAINSAADMLSNTASNGKAMVVFTDGRNNAWSAPEFENSAFVLNKLQNQTLSGDYISSFIIGLEGKGGIDDAELSKLALNGGFFDTTDDIEILGKIFNKFANSVGSIYTFRYDRNNSYISTPLQLRFKIKTQLF